MNLFSVTVITVKRSRDGSNSYLEALIGPLSTSNVLSSVGADDNGDLVVVAAEELLSPADNVPNDNRGSEREDQMLVVWVQNESLVHLACREETESEMLDNVRQDVRVVSP